MTPIHRCGFTLFEVLVVITIILILVGILIPGISMLRNSIKRAKTIGLIDGITGALEIYVMEDGRHRYPTPDADQCLRTNGDVGVPNILDKLRELGSQWRIIDLEKASGSNNPDRLVDAWRRPVLYAVDSTIDNVIVRPAPTKTEWNPTLREPFAYVWSYGRPSGDEVADADPAAKRWLYHGSPN